jgi:lactoylglutathione lyase
VSRPRLVGINHVALEVDDLDRALEFWNQLFDCELRGRVPGAAFIDLGDQFIALMEGRSQPRDTQRHFGLVVDDKAATRRALEAAGIAVLPGPGLDFLDPSGNRIQVVQYDEIQFSKTAEVLGGMSLELGKTARARAELRAKGLASPASRPD